jgi:hypothetical protein
MPKSDVLQTLGAKLALFRLGDPDCRSEWSEFTDFAMLDAPGSPPRPGVVRILYSLSTGRSRVLMRSADTSTVLLNHFICPGAAPTATGDSVIYRTADPHCGETISIHLRFACPAAARYFSAKADEASGVNALHSVSGSRLTELAFDPSAPFSGIIAYLTHQCDGNVDSCGEVAISASSVANELDIVQPRNLANLADGHKWFCSDDLPNSWICYDFGRRHVVVTNYSLRSWSGGTRGAGNLRSWVLEGSDGGGEWRELDRREGNTQLNGNDAIASFRVAREEQMRMIRLRQTDQNHWDGKGTSGGYHRIVLQAFELFGTLVESEESR